MSLKWDPNIEGIVVISCHSEKTDSVVCQIIGQKSFSTPVKTDFEFKTFLWSFETKYYSANVYIYPFEEKVDLEEKFCDNIQAVIFSFDAKSQSSFEEVLKWVPYLKNINAEVQLLICENCHEECNENSDLKRTDILKWCVENDFELVELNPPKESNDEEEDEEVFKNAKGYGRVVEALQTHTWANLVMKDSKCTKKEKSLVPETEEKSSVEENAEPGSLAAEGTTTSCTPREPDSRKIKVEGDELDLEEKWLHDIISGDDPGGESFEALFSRFASMKDKAEGLSGEDRKKYAEKVAVAFWRAMGGDEDEIEGLDDLED